MAASESRRYCVAAGRDAPAAPAVGAAPPAAAPDDTFVSRNAGALAVAVAPPAVPAVPVVAVAVSVPREMHPVTVIIFEAELLGVRDVCVAVVGSCGAGRAGAAGGGGFCAITTVARPSVMAAQVPDHVALFIVPPCGVLPAGDGG